MSAVAVKPNPTPNQNRDRNQDLERDLKNLGDKLTPPPSDVNDLINLLLLAENLLSKVDPEPSRSMSGAVFPVMKALVDKDLLYHKEVDVKTALASCFCEMMIIALPGCPYGHDFMKPFFQTIVDALKDLDDTSSHLYLKKASVLKTFTRVHSFLMMLDLEYDDLIIEMFQHFLKTTRPVDDVAVFSSMETIMTRLINESEDKLLSRLLESLVNDIKRKDSNAGRLVEKVIGNCVGKLDPYLKNFVQSNVTSHNEHSNIIASILQKKTDTLGLDLPSTAAECLNNGRKRRKISARKVTGMELSARQQTKYEKLTGELRIIDDLSGEHLEVSEDEIPALDATLVGHKIKVWWVDDERYYEGVVDSFYPESNKHKVVYVDGDEESLRLETEYWRLL